MVEDALMESDGGTYIRVEVTPAAKKVEIRYNEWRKAIEVKVKSPAKAGKANRELLELFSSMFGDARIVKGESSRSKVIFVSVAKDVVVAKLKELANTRNRI